MTTPELPFERSYWADPGKLMAGYYPGEADEVTAQAKLEALLDSGVRHVVNLMKETQHPADKNDVIPYQDQLMSIAEDAGIDVTYVLHPIVDQDIPSREMMKSILDDIDRAVGDGARHLTHSGTCGCRCESGPLQQGDGHTFWAILIRVDGFEQIVLYQGLNQFTDFLTVHVQVFEIIDHHRLLHLTVRSDRVLSHALQLYKVRQHPTP